MYKQIIILIVLISCISIVQCADPIAEYRFNDGGAYGDSLDRVIDYTLNEHYGVGYGNITYINGVFGDGLDFDNQYSYVTIPDHNDLSFSTLPAGDGDFSISFWINADLYENVIFLSKGHFTPDHEYSCYVGTDSRIVFYMKDRSVIPALDNFKFSKSRDKLSKYNNEWLNVVITHGPFDEINMFVNGEKWKSDQGIGANYTGMEDGTDNVTIGQCNSFPNTVQMDEVVIWDSYITLEGVKDLYEYYLPETYNIQVLSKNHFSIDNNYSVYEGDNYIGTYAYGDTFNLTNMRDYTFILEEDITDSIAHIENVNDIATQGTSYFVYIVMGITLLAFIIYIYKKF